MTPDWVPSRTSVCLYDRTRPTLQEFDLVRCPLRDPLFDLRNEEVATQLDEVPVFVVARGDLETIGLGVSGPESATTPSATAPAKAVDTRSNAAIFMIVSLDVQQTGWRPGVPEIVR